MACIHLRSPMILTIIMKASWLVMLKVRTMQRNNIRRVTRTGLPVRCMIIIHQQVSMLLTSMWLLALSPSGPS